MKQKLAHRTESAKGTVKKLFGRATGSRRMHGEGRRDQAAGNVKQAGDNLGDAFKH
ncbi:CsbD family protein [Nocardia sp. NPDC046473]|uniref:CsbD family protein n=1 Tax=Nocardia sp. NPDC046473 TaxID=3155733 RepID=UPI0033CA48B5